MVASLSPFVQSVREFQQLGLVNKAVIDATAVDIPLVALAKNETERKERFLRQALVLLIAFIIAPLHARAISKLFSKGIGFKSAALNEQLMQVSYRDLGNKVQLKKGLDKLFRQLNQPIPKVLANGVTESLRKRIVEAKTRFLMSDLAVCGLLLSSVGFIKVLFGKLLSGKDQFSGEFGIVSEDKLNKLYQKEKSKEGISTQLKGLITLGLGIGVPIALGLGLLQVLKRPNPGGFFKFLQSKLAPRLDYNYSQHTRFLKNWPLLSDGSQVLLALLLTTGELTSARSKREFKELAIQRNSIDAMFFFGTPAIMKLISGSTTVQGAIDRVKAKSPELVQRVANRAAVSYLASFALASLAVAGIVTLTNNITRKAVKDDAQKLDLPKMQPARQVPVMPTYSAAYSGAATNPAFLPWSVQPQTIYPTPLLPGQVGQDLIR